MGTLDIFLIIICGAGLIHGLFLSGYIGFVKNKRNLSDILLALILLFMALRVGKSIIFQFNTELELLIIFFGLSTLLLIGPLLNWYQKSMLLPNFKWSKWHYLQAIPFLVVLFFSPFLTEPWFREHGVHWAYIIISGIYLHLAIYIFVSFRRLYRFNKSFLATEQKTKSQENILAWLKYVMIGITLIWVSYVLNVFEEQIPYITGPIIYSICIYILTYKAYSLKINELDAKAFETQNENSPIYQELVALMKKEELYLSPDLSLNKLGELTGYSTHLISSSINDYAKMNFNNFINQFRIEKAKEILKGEQSEKFTIASIAYDTGFNSLSSFNTAFKKFEKTTPSRYRKEN